MEITNKDYELLKIILEDCVSYFEDKSGNDFYLQGEDTSERFEIFKKIIETQADEEDKEELLENLTCWTYDIWVVRYLVSLPNQTKLNYTQLEMCLLLLEEIQEVPCLLHGEFRFEKSETDFLNDISFINNFNINEGVYYIDSLEITNYLIKKIKNCLLYLS
ncbi:hypothetical protein L292_1990 [Acinetobacter junii CIP 107470 = MTCC 11364]|uniref:Uncharacterized protein n=1 Tax=Acinetobacter junii CIP 107470 = MTCC 11364 TaxID=1217666 RepID=S7YHK2_ACIJU|nr:hypothetical protein [Acinetobacter junii]ENV50352.1 hypothetical protein F953_02266 [Acinetobacter junii CIP 107470 = MTCC 11364]EPR87523.1 hypothetical protein L292_1990 [Acinetobacter junii CIP 107470 = MTCC 11364]